MVILERKLEKFIYNLIYLYSIFVLVLSGVIGILAYKLNNDYLKLWKEVYLIILVVLCYCKDLIFFRNSKRFILINLLAILVIFYFLFSKTQGIENFFIFYQIKNDLPLLIFYIFFSMKKYLDLNRNKMYKLVRLFIKIVIFSVVLGIIESLFPNFIIEKILKVPINSRAAGVTTIYAFGRLRPFGIFQNYVQFGELAFLCFIIIFEKYRKKYLIKCLLVLGVLLSTYKTCYLGIIIYLVYKILNRIKFSRKLKAIFFYGILLIQLLTYTTEYIYIFFKKVLQVNSSIVESSLYGRVSGGYEIFYEISKSVSNFLFGLGFGKNGSTEVMKRILGEKVLVGLPVDSLFLAIISNYGIIVTVIVIFSGTYLVYKEKNSLLQYIYIYYFFISFYLNNFVNIMNILVICFIIFYEKGGDKNGREYIKQTKQIKQFS